jgi:hypothetical protein
VPVPYTKIILTLVVYLKVLVKFILTFQLNLTVCLLHLSTMADNQSKTSSTVAPGDSVSSAGRKRKPGKAERIARRSQVGSQPGGPAASEKASAFSAGSIIPVAQPGRYPVVFQTGAGEPSRDRHFAISGPVLKETLTAFPGRFTPNPKYAQFKAHSEISDADFKKNLVSAALLRLAQQVVHSHVNMGLPQGDFSPVASTDVRIPASIAAYTTQFGEFSVPALGTRFLYSGYEDTISHLVWCADAVHTSGRLSALSRLWLPMSASDHYTKAVVADALNRFLGQAGVTISSTELEEAVLSGDVPDVWENVKDLLGDEDVQDRFDFLFKSYDLAQFFAKFSADDSLAVLDEIGLEWRSPLAGHLNWSYNVKQAFTRLADTWAKLSAAYAQFFELTAGAATRTTASGSQAQMVEVASVSEVCVLKTHLALSAPEFSLAACFPPSCSFENGLTRLVVLTTPLSVSQRATEFCQLDWR